MKLRYIIFGCIAIGLFVRVFQYQNALFSDWDEGIYAEVASDMAARDSYLLPEFNGQTYLDKPPVTSTLTAIAFKLFPEHKELASRSMMTIAAIGLLGITYLLSRKITLFFFSKSLNELAEWQKELIFFSPVFVTALTPVFLDRAVRLNTDSILALSWLGYFLAGTSMRGKLMAVVLGTWTKSIAGFYPMMFDIFSFSFSKEKKRQFFWYIAIVVAGLSWLLINYMTYGDAFVKAHVQDQLFKRIYVPIELHFGGRLFYPTFLVKELSFTLVIIVLSYWTIAWDIMSKVRLQTGKNYLQKLSLFLQSADWSFYLILLSPLPFFALLTFAKSKIWWYMIMLMPFFALTVPYFLMKIRHKTLRLVVMGCVFAFFLYRFLPQTYLLKTVEDSPEKLRVAKCAAHLQGDRVLIMVNEQERKNRNVVEAAQLQTASSFMYGGSPSFVYYADKPVVHYYRVDELLGRLLEKDKKSDILVVSKDDLSKQEFKEIGDLLINVKRETTCYFGEWAVYHL